MSAQIDFGFDGGDEFARDQVACPQEVGVDAFRHDLTLDVSGTQRRRRP